MGKWNPAVLVVFLVLAGLVAVQSLGLLLRRSASRQTEPAESLIQSALRQREEAAHGKLDNDLRARRAIDFKFMKEEQIRTWCSSTESVKDCADFFSVVTSNQELKKSLQKVSQMGFVIFLLERFDSVPEGVFINIHSPPEEIIKRLQ